jgi:hypothetical protein
MKKISYLFLLIFLISLLASSCSNTKTYAQSLDDEQTLITAYIKRNNFQIVTTFPTDLVWVKNGNDIYYKAPSGLYFHMINPGNLSSKDTIQLNNTVVPRYKEFTLDIVSDTISNWNTIDYPYPSNFTYGDLTQSYKAFNEAVSYMKRIDSEAKLIVPSQIGFSADMNSVIPKGFDLKIKFQK